MRRIRLAAAFAALTLAGLVMVPAPATWACSCAVSDESDYAASADTIFVGIVTRTDLPSSTAGMITTEFLVRGAACGLDFVVGGEYWVYSKEGKTNFCMGTRAQATPSPQPSVDGFPLVWLAIPGGLAVAALILYFMHIRRL